MSEDDRSFEEAASERPRGLVREFFWFARRNRKWWLVPIIVILLALAGLVVLASTGAGPLIYPLF